MYFTVLAISEMLNIMAQHLNVLRLIEKLNSMTKIKIPSSKVLCLIVHQPINEKIFW